MTGVENQDIRFTTVDGVDLAGTVYEPTDGSEEALLVNSAMATPRSFYRPMAEWFAERDFTVLTFDYRGIGDSLSGPIRESDATIEDWARRDIRAGIDWLSRQSGSERPYVIGHSMGGQIMGLLGNEIDIQGLITFSAQSGYWRIQYPGQRLNLLVASYGVFPLLTMVFGYLPWSKLFGGEDIPPEVARQWYRWCRHPDYLLGDETLNARKDYRRFEAPILAYSFEDDVWGYEQSVDRLMNEYTTTRVERVHLVPEEVNVDSIGHFGFFKEEMGFLWEELLDRMQRL